MSHQTFTLDPVHRRWRWYLPVVTILFVIGAILRLWSLGTVPPGMTYEELLNAQISDLLRGGDLRVLYDQIQPAREVVYYAILAGSTTVTGRGLILWRLPSVWIGMLGLAVSASLFRRLYGVRVALMAVGLMAVTFWPVWMSRAILHVTLMPLVTSLVLYVLIRAYSSRGRIVSALWYTAAGIALGAAQYTHVTAWALLLIPMVFVVIRWFQKPRDIRRHWGNIFYAVALGAVIILPLFIYLSRNPGARVPMLPDEQPVGLGGAVNDAVATLSGLFLRGDMFPNHNLPGRPILDPLVGGLLVIGIGVSAARWRRPPYALALLWLGLGLLPALAAPRAPDFEHMAVVLPVIFALPAIGLRAVYGYLRDHLRSRRWQGRAQQAVGPLVALIIVSGAVWTGIDYFGRWPALGDVRLNHDADLGVLAHYLDTTTDPGPISVCATLPDGADPFALSNDRLLGYLMHRQRSNIHYFDCTQTLLLASGGESQRLVFPRSHYYDSLPGPLLAWMRGARDEGVPGIRPDVVMRVDVRQTLADRAGAFITTAPVAWAPETGIFELAPLPVAFASNVTFLGYEIRDSYLWPGDTLEVTTYWRLDGPPPAPITIFVHLLGNPVVVLAQRDTLGVDVSHLQARDVFIQYTTVQIPAATSPGMYPVSVGLYFPDSGTRLQVFQNGQVRSDRLFLERITILPD